MDVSITSLAGSNPPSVVVRADASSMAARRAPAIDTNAVNSSRLNAVRDLIAKLTGRQVKLVPPAAYIVSAPEGAQLFAPVELLAPLGLAGQLSQQQGPLTVDISAVLRTGTTERMLLGQDEAGALQLRAAVDLEL